MSELERLRAAALALYMAGRWELMRCRRIPPQIDEATLWADLRDALGLP